MVTVEGVETFDIDVACSVVLSNGVTIEMVQAQINEAVNNYFSSLRKTWELTDYITVRTSQIETRILGVSGVVDVSNTTINGGTSNIELNSNQTPVINGDVGVDT